MAFKTGNEDKELVIQNKQDSSPRSWGLCRKEPVPSGAFFHSSTFKKQEHLIYARPCSGFQRQGIFSQVPSVVEKGADKFSNRGIDGSTEGKQRRSTVLYGGRCKGMLAQEASTSC